MNTEKSLQNISNTLIFGFKKIEMLIIIGLEMTLLKIRKFVSMISRSNPLFLYVLKKKDEFKIDSNFYQDFKVRWNTTYIMLTRYLELKKSCK